MGGRSRRGPLSYTNIPLSRKEHEILIFFFVRKGETFYFTYVIQIASLLFHLKPSTDHLVDRYGPQSEKHCSRLSKVLGWDGTLFILTDISRNFPRSLQEPAGPLNLPQFQHHGFFPKPFSL
jgi:hypothetical protein